jgi:hypothetical protein
MLSDKWYDEHKYIIADIYRLLNTLKKRCLQAEYLEIKVAMVQRKFTNLEDLQQYIEDSIEEITKNIKMADREFFQKVHENHYSVYTEKHYPSLYWSEIESPELVEYYFYEFAGILQMLMPEGKIRCEIDGEDLFPCKFCCENLDDVHRFKNVIRFVDDFTVYRIEGRHQERLFML